MSLRLGTHNGVQREDALQSLGQSLGVAGDHELLVGGDDQHLDLGVGLGDLQDVAVRSSHVLLLVEVDTEEGEVAGNERAQLAMDLMARGAIKLIGTYTAEMNGLDVLVFTAGVGENDRRTRALIAQNLSFFGLKFDAEKNATAPHGDILELSTPDSPNKILVIPTDEEFMIACDTEALAKAL